MGKRSHDIAQAFSIYTYFDGWDRWRFRRLLRWIRDDPVSLQRLLDFERQLVERPMHAWAYRGYLVSALRWYNEELDRQRLASRPRPEQLRRLFEVVLVFLEAGPQLHRAYRDLLVRIVRASARLRARGWARPGIRPRQFRREAAKAICRLGARRQNWKAWDPALNAQAVRRLACLETIAAKVGDLRQFRAVYQDGAPPIGLEATCSLLAMVRDYRAFSRYLRRTSAPFERWRLGHGDLFRTVESTAELDRVLAFLGMLAEHPLMRKCARYDRARHPQHDFRPADKVKEACLGRDWDNARQRDAILERLAGRYVQNLVSHELAALWSKAYGAKIRWAFDTFTSYVPYEERTRNWTADAGRTRGCWNWQRGQAYEHSCFVDALLPRLCARFRELSPEAFETALDLLPSHLDVEQFTAVVNVPVAWEKDTVLQEGYQRHIGFYNEEVEVARPTRFAPHTFVFERPALQRAIDLLDDAEALRRAIQAHTALEA
ncbi:MAG: hypothetical protein JXA09_01445 [Anaerolineae bacterium]|nr:hypothetical protein [Anaerolineae bacterium]